MSANRAKKRRNKKKAVEKSAGGMSLQQRWQAFQKGKSPILFFLLKFCAVLVPFYVLWYTDFFQTSILYGWNCANTTISSFVLNIFGAETTAVGDVLSGPGASIQIFDGCDGFEPTMLLIAGILAFPAPGKHKLKGILWGSLFLLSVNFLRILSLYLTQLYWPEIFDFMHLEFWQVLFIILAISTWVFWNRKTPLPNVQNHEEVVPKAV